MFCKKCGNEIEGDSRFCGICGAEIPHKAPVVTDILPPSPVEVNTTPAPSSVSVQTPPPDFHPPVAPSYPQGPSPAKPKKRKKGLIITIIVLVALIALALTGVILYFTSAAHDVYDSMTEGKFSAALSTYKREVKDHFIDEAILDSHLNGYTKTIVDKFKSGDLTFDAAVEGLEAMEAMGFGDNEALLKEITALHTANTALDTGNTYFNKGDYISAIKEYSKIEKDDEKYKDAQTKLSELYPVYIQSVVDTANGYIQNKNYETVLTYVDTAYDILPDGVDTSKLDKVKNDALTAYKTYITGEVSRYLANEDYATAFSTINKALTVNDNEEFQTTKDSAEKAYIDKMTKAVQNHLKNEDYISAKRTVTAALDLLPGNSDLVKLQTEVEDKTPTYLLDVCQPYATDGYVAYANGETFTSATISFTNGVSFAGYGAYATYNLKENYTTLSFSIGHVDSTSRCKGVIKIYCDEILKKEISMNADDLPQRYTIDITGVSQLKIMREKEHHANDGCRYGLGNVIIK